MPKFNLKAETSRDVMLHLLIIIMVALLLVLTFFYGWLPYTTNHGQTITVPNVVGMKTVELDKFLGTRDLEYFVSDSTYVPGAEPLTVFSQFPLSGANVKQGRKIYVTINSKNPPNVKMPDLANRSLLNAQGELESFGLVLGEIRYKPDLQQNSVLQALYNGKPVTENSLVPKGARIDLIVGDGQGNQEFDMPDLVGKPQDEAELTLNGSSLQVGTITYESHPDREQGLVLKQRPAAGNKIRVGDVVDLWVIGTDPTAGPESGEDGK
ncbi:MAG: PASTA domain-containing protein [Bacteroidota bacterium]